MRFYLILPILMCLLPVRVQAQDKFALFSPDFKTGETLPIDHVFNDFGCTGKNKAPVLEWKNVPRDTKSLAITVYDPDAPTGSGWWHWTVFNIPATQTLLDIEKDGLPVGAIQGRTDYGSSQYGGACPPQGDKPHRYIFTLYALNIEALPLDQNASGAMVGYYLNANKIAAASTMAVYSRPNDLLKSKLGK